MDSQSQQPKKRTPKKSTLKIRELMGQIKDDITPLFREIFDKEEPACIEKFNATRCEEDPSLSVITFLSRNLLSPVTVIIFNTELVIIPLFITPTAESYIKTEEKRLVNPQRIGVYFIHEDPSGFVDISTCLAGAIKISKNQNNKTKLSNYLYTSQSRTIEL